MENKKRYILIAIVMMLLVVSVSTYAWLSYRSKETAMVLTIGEVGSMSITLKPYKFNSSITPSLTYEGNDYVNVNAINETSNNTYNIGLYYKINNIPEELVDDDFKYTILRSSDGGTTFEEYDNGNFSNASSGSEYVILNNETLNSNTKYYYRVYLWVDGSVSDNTDMQGKVFDAELRASYETAKPDLEYNIVKVNNSDSDSLGTGFYALSNYNCQNGTTLTFDTITRKISANGVDKCDLEFTSAADPLLYDVVEIGDYIKYTGNNGCNTENQSSNSNCTNCNSCSGWNANQTATDMYDNYGYCSGGDYKYYVYGWRVLYKADDSVYIVSAGSPECVTTPYAESIDTSTSSLTLNNSYKYYYGTHYKFDASTGIYSLDTNAEGYMSVVDSFKNLCTSSACSIANYYTCRSTSETGTCTTMYKIDSYLLASGANVYKYGRKSAGIEKNNLLFNNNALKYCNTSYLAGGICDLTTAHALNGDDFFKFTSQYYGNSNGRYLYSFNDGGTYGSPYCYLVTSDIYCGYNNDIIDIGGFYWFSSAYNANVSMSWKPDDRKVVGSMSGTYVNGYGFRPVLKLDSSIKVTGGKGNIENPYNISLRN